MQQKSCVYILNENPIYHAMFSVSIRTFRKHNPNLRLRLVYVNDNNQDSWSATNNLFKDIDPYYTSRFMYFMKEDIFRLVKELNVELTYVEELPYKSQNFVSIQRCLFKDMDFNDVILLDVDTFCFKPIDNIFEKYQDFDFVATPLVGINFGSPEPNIVKHKMRFTYFENDIIIKENLLPYNSGVVYWKGNLLQKYGSVVLDYCNRLLYKKHPMSDMMFSLRPDARNREEVACNLFVLENGIKSKFFDEKDVSTFDYHDDLSILHATSNGFPFIFSKLAYEQKLIPN